MLNNKGFGLIEVTVGMGIVGVLTLALVDMQVVAVKTQANAAAEQGITGYIANIRQNLGDPARATASLAGNSLNGTYVIKDPLIPANVMAAADFQDASSNVWRVKSIQSVATSVPTRANLYRITFNFVFEKDRNRTLGLNIIRRPIAEVYCLAPSNVITQCFGSVDTQTLAQQTCVSMGATWNTTTGVCGVVTSSGSDNTGNGSTGDDDHGGSNTGCSDRKSW